MEEISPRRSVVGEKRRREKEKENREREEEKRRMKGISGRGRMIERGERGEVNTAKEVNSGNFSDGSA